jgi:hypothetical protein
VIDLEPVVRRFGAVIAVDGATLLDRARAS